MKRFLILIIFINFNIFSFESLTDAENYLKNKSKTWSFEKFKDILEQVILSKSINGHYKNFINKVTPLDEAKFIVFGSLKSSFKSFLNSLKFLLEKKVIDDRFNIIKPGFFIVIMGVFSGQNYNFETLTLVLKLIQKNPNLTFYLKTQDESNYNWLNNDVKNQLRNLLKDKKNYLKKYHNTIYKINNFFNFNPYSLYISNGKTKSFIRISNFGFSYNNIKEQNFKNLLENLRFNSIETLNLNDIFYKIDYEDLYLKNYSYVKSIIKSPNKLRNYESLKGLNTLNTKYGATKWKIFSSSNRFYRKYFNAYYNSFCLINIKNKLKDSTISVYNKDTKTSSNFSKYKTYNIITSKILNTEDEFLINNKEDNLDKIKLKNLLENIKNISEKITILENRLNNHLSKLKKASYSPKFIRSLND